MKFFVAELVGTMILILLGDGVVANVILSKNKGEWGGFGQQGGAWPNSLRECPPIGGRLSPLLLRPCMLLGRDARISGCLL